MVLWLDSRVTTSANVPFSFDFSTDFFDVAPPFDFSKSLVVYSGVRSDNVNDSLVGDIPDVDTVGVSASSYALLVPGMSDVSHQ